MKYTLDWNQYTATAVNAVSEGIVMLKNDNSALPLRKGEEIAIFGRIQLHYYKSGTGSGGMVNVSKVVGILDGLLDAGVKVNSKLLDAYKAWDDAHPYDLGGGWGGEPWSQEEMHLEESLVKDVAGTCQTAVVIIGRTAGEEQDNKVEQGSYLLTDKENEMLRIVRQYFQKVVVLLNVGNIMDMQFIDDYKPDSVLYVWQGGMVGGTGTAKVLTGEVSPSGKLTDTIAYNVKDYPSDPYFGNENSNTYIEDIYVGYRYFETFAKEKVRYPFGYGLSYTTFTLKAGNPTLNEETEQLMLPVTVTNIGNFAGKEVVQLYCEAPQGKLGKPARVLTAFTKTKTLAPNESETVFLPIVPPVSYDDSGVTGYAYHNVLEAGDYRFYAGTDVRNAQFEIMIQIPENVPSPQKSQSMPPVEHFQRMKPVPSENGYTVAFEDVPTLNFDEHQRRLDNLPEEFPPTDKKSVLADVLNGTVTMQEFIAQMTNEELAQIVRGEGMGSPRVTAGTASAFGGVSEALEKYGIPAGCCSDGPSGMRLDCGTKAFSLPNGTMLACTFNTDLLTELFYLVGLEMTNNHVECLLGAGMNIHRHPLNGRNFEYFSEDPLVTGKMATAQLKGLHQAGVTGTIKHCCANNQETNRHFLNSVISERAIREIYLRGFEIAVKEGNANSIMTTYGAVNGIWTAGNYDLCTQIIRNEWGFQGIIMTDWWANINNDRQAPDKTDFASMVRAQNDIYMVCADPSHNDDNIMQSLENGSLTRAELQRNASNICQFLMHTHAMERLLNQEVEVEIINRPTDENDDTIPVEHYDLDGETTLDLHHVNTDKGKNFAFMMHVNRPAWYNVTLTANSAQSELAQIPVTIFSMGTASGTFTWNGTGGKSVSFTNKIPMFSRFTTMRLYFAQSGLNMESIRFEIADDNVDVANLV